MKKFLKPFIAGVCALSTFVGITIAQIPDNNKKELESKHESLLKEINETQKLLNATQEERKVSMSQLKMLQNQVNKRQSLIKNLENEIQEVNKDIANKTKEINELSSQIDKLRYLYAQSVRYSYKHQSAHTILAFVLTADNFNDGMKRYQYMKKNRDFRKHQADQLKTGQKKIENNIHTLDKQKKKNEELKITQVEQKKVIEEESKLTQKLVEDLKGKENDLIASIEKKKSDAKKLDALIKNIIREEVRLTQLKKENEERIRREEENKRQQELARIEKEKEQQRLREIEEQRKKDELEKKRLDEQKRIEEQRRQESLVKNEENKNVDKSTTTSSTPSSIQPKTTTTTSTTTEKKINNTPKTTEKPVEKNTVVASSTPIVNEPPKVVNKQEPPPSYKNSLTPDMQLTSNNFLANKGRLPSPITGGYVSAPFGKYPHPLEPKVTLENMGVDLASKPGTPVRCVYNGSITTVVTIAGTYTVIVNHGEYFTVYSNLSSVSVSKGQSITTNQQIGVVGANDEGEHIVHFEVCRVGPGNTIVNEDPLYWIVR